MPKSQSEFEYMRSVCGDAFADTLIEKCGGMQLYVPKKDNRREVNLKYIRDHYDGRNIGSIARHLKVTRRSVEIMLDEKIEVAELPEDVRLPRVFT